MQAETPAEVYPVEQLVGGVNVLRNMNVKGWIDKTNAGLDVQTRSLFLSKRLKRVVDSGDVKRLRALRYLLLLVEWFKALKVMPKGGRKVPKVEDMGAMVEEWGSETVAGIARRFADDS